MAADVEVHEGHVTIVGSELFLRDEQRQSGMPGGEVRRAMVHDSGDALTINYDHDYRGGLRLRGVRTISTYDPSGFIVADEHRRRVALEGSLDITHEVTADHAAVTEVTADHAAVTEVALDGELTVPATYDMITGDFILAEPEPATRERTTLAISEAANVRRTLDRAAVAIRSTSNSGLTAREIDRFRTLVSRPESAPSPPVAVDLVATVLELHNRVAALEREVQRLSTPG